MSFFRALQSGDKWSWHRLAVTMSFVNATLSLSNLVKHLQLSPTPNWYLLALPASLYLVATIYLVFAARTDDRGDHIRSIFASMACMLFAAAPVLHQCGLLLN